MHHLRNIERLLPALVMAAGVALLAAGLLSYVPPTLNEPQTAAPGVVGDPRLEPEGTRAPAPATRPPATLAPEDSAAPPATATPLVIGSDAPATPPSPPPPPPPPPTERSFATRIRIPQLRIDLPVVAGDLAVPGNESGYPLCDVAMYLLELGQPGETGTTYIYAHAQRGMFLPLLRASESNDGAGLIGGLVEVYTSANELHLYEIVRVKRHATDLSIVTEAGDREQLVLQTSEGPTGTLPKLQVAAEPVGVIRATSAEAQPSPQPRACGP